MAYSQSNDGGLFTPSYTKTGMVNEINVKQTGKVVRINIQVTPTTTGIHNIVSGLPITDSSAYGFGVIDSSGARADSWLRILGSGILQVYVANSENVKMDFTLIYLTT